MTTNRDLMYKLAEVSDRLEKIEKKIFKRDLSFDASIPPTSLCRDLFHWQGRKSWDNEMQLLADYYGVVPMGNYHSPEKVPKKSIACYHSFENAAYYKEPKTSIETVLHEFFHHLVARQVVVLKPRQKEEKWADCFAKLIVQRGHTI